MPKRRPSPPSSSVLGAALAIAPASVGCAVGLLIARRMKDPTREAVASALFAAGALAAVPLAVNFIGRTVRRQRSRRIASRTLSGIRGGEEIVSDEIV